MKRLILLTAILLSFNISAQADPPTECPRLILTFYRSGTNLGRFWLCQSVNFNPEPPNQVTCSINSEEYYDVGEYDLSSNQWWIYGSTPEFYDSYQIRIDPLCSTSKKGKSSAQ